jgi:hypothetical protein
LSDQQLAEPDEESKELAVLLESMKHPVNGFEVRKRKYMGKYYDNCFVGIKPVSILK